MPIAGGPVKLSALIQTLQAMHTLNGGADADVASWLMTSDRVREILSERTLTDAEVREILHDLQRQRHWGDPPIDDQLVEGVIHLGGLEGPDNAPNG